MIKVVVAEDHALVRQGIGMLLSATGGFELVAETAVGSEVKVPHAVPTYILTGDTSPQRIRAASEPGSPILHNPVDAHTLRNLFGG